MQKNILEHWQDISQVQIPPLETQGFTENVLIRDIWNKPEDRAQRQPQESNAPTDATEEPSGSPSQPQASAESFAHSQQEKGRTPQQAPQESAKPDGDATELVEEETESPGKGNEDMAKTPSATKPPDDDETELVTDEEEDSDESEEKENGAELPDEENAAEAQDFPEPPDDEEDETALLVQASAEDETKLLPNGECPDDEDMTVILPAPEPDEPEEPEEVAYLVRSNTNERIDINADHFVIGKSSTTDYQIQGNNAISRVHISIIKTETGYEMEDLDSSNHTYIDGQEITEPVLLEEGQVFKMADEEFSFHIDRKNP